MDEAQLQLVITAANDRVLAGLSSFERSLNQIEKAHVSAGQQAERHTALLDKLGGQFERFSRFANIFIAFEAIKGAFSAFDQLDQHNIALLRTMQLLGGNAEAASTWAVAANELDLGLDVLDKAFAKLSSNLNSGSSAALKQMGIAAEDTRGKLRPLTDVLNDAVEYFHRHQGAANNAALANELFGRSGYLLLPVLESGRAGLSALAEEARKYGLVLDRETIERNAMFSFQLKQTELALDGVGLAFGNAALPGVAALGQALSRVIEDNLPAFIAGMNRAVSYVIGFIEAVTGLPLKVDEGALALSGLSKMTGDTGTAMDNGAAASKRMQDAIERIRDRTKEATGAIEDQIRALNNQMEAQRFMDRQAQLQQNLADKTHDLGKLQHQQFMEFWMGNFSTYQDITDQITKAEEDKSNLEKQLTQNTVDEQTKSRIQALEDQKKGIEDASNKQIDAMQKAARSSADAMAVAAGSLPPLFKNAGQKAGDQMKFALDKSAESIGQSMGANLVDALLGPQVWVEGDRKIKGHFERRGGGDWMKVGEAIGSAIGAGIATAIGASAMAAIKAPFHSLGDKINDLANQIQSDPVARSLLGGYLPALRIDANWLRSFHQGGIVPGSPSQDVFAVLKGGERVQTKEQQEAADMAETNALLRELIMAVKGSGGGGSAGVQAKLFNAIDSAERWRDRGVVGART